MSSALSPYEFAAEPRYARRVLEQYARQFTVGPVADLGTGRGYFLSALRERGLDGVGVDIGEEAERAALEQGHDFVRRDAIAYLATARGLGGIFAAHLIEHLQPADAERLIDLSMEALVPGGRIVIVTPNMADWRTLTDIFWVDTTHVRPYPPRLIAALLERRGFIVDTIGRGVTPQGKRAIPRVMLGRLRFGRDFGVTEVFVAAHRSAINS